MQSLNKLQNLNSRLNSVGLKGIGLSSKEAERRLKLYGPNEIERTKKISPMEILFAQFTDLMIIILLACTAISFFLGDITEAYTIIAIVILNAFMGFIEEYRSEKSIEALKSMVSPTARVVRNGKVQNINAKDIVPGDILIIHAGDRVSADGILVEGLRLQSDESILTGESVPVEKVAAKQLDLDKEDYSKDNIVFMGTVMTSGSGKMLVTHTGMMTEMGKIAGMIQSIEDEQTPLQKKLEHLGKLIVAISLVVCAAVVGIGLIRGEDVFNMFLSGVSLAVAAVPEGLPAIVTVALAIGVQNMAKKNALVRKLPAVETLGCASIICSDKTGTLTENKMTVKKIYVDGRYYHVTGIGYDNEGSFYETGRLDGSSHGMYSDAPSLDKKVKGSLSLQKKSQVQVNIPAHIRMLLKIGVLCNNSTIDEKPKRKSNFFIRNLLEKKEDISSISGDPTELALLIAALKAGIKRQDLDKHYVRIDEIPFDSDRKCMSVICRTKSGEKHLFVKGAPDVILKKCSKIHSNNRSVEMTEMLRKKILEVNSAMGNQALRVLGFAFKNLGRGEKCSAEGVETELEFIGLMGMIDPPRKGVISSIQKCKEAGIKTVMITGDHQNTAAAIAREIGMLEDGGRVISYDELETMSDKALRQNCNEISVYARVSPRHKLKIVKALKDNGHVVAMTGDGVNDAPAIKEADIGVAMGISGTDVTKEASSMILTDDNFSTIVAAVEEGRVIYSNIRKFIRYMLSCNIGEVLTMLLGTALGFPIPLLPIQILWVNLVTDGLPAIALGFEPAEQDIMTRPPRASSEGVFSQGLAATIIWRGIIIGFGTLMVFASVGYYTNDLLLARTATFTTLCIMQFVYVFECKSETRSFLEIPIFNNLILIIAVMISFLMLTAVIYIPSLQRIFKTCNLGINEWAMVIGFSLLGPILTGLYRAFRRRDYNR